ncbi:hypothetical protein C8R45DRAFT_1193366 [Mycena sanguinolenta]|nr:hypothetical protein C8R45DRAFT_1193366 [Mycena sanguinolenta]
MSARRQKEERARRLQDSQRRDNGMSVVTKRLRKLPNIDAHGPSVTYVTTQAFAHPPPSPSTAPLALAAQLRSLSPTASWSLDILVTAEIRPYYRCGGGRVDAMGEKIATRPRSRPRGAQHAGGVGNRRPHSLVIFIGGLKCMIMSGTTGDSRCGDHAFETVSMRRVTAGGNHSQVHPVCVEMTHPSHPVLIPEYSFPAYRPSEPWVVSLIRNANRCLLLELKHKQQDAMKIRIGQPPEFLFHLKASLSAN